MLRTLFIKRIIIDKLRISVKGIAMKEAYIDDSKWTSVKEQLLYVACRGPQPANSEPLENLIDWGHWVSAYTKKLYDNRHNPKYTERIEKFME